MVVYRWGRRGSTQFCKLFWSFFWSSGCAYVALSCYLISTYSAVKNTIILLMIKRQRESPVVAHPTWGFPRATQASVNRPDDDDDDNGDDQPTWWWPCPVSWDFLKSIITIMFLSLFLLKTMMITLFQWLLSKWTMVFDLVDMLHK